MTISAAAIIFDDPLTPVNISGLLVTIVSIAAYNYIKISKMRREAIEATHHRERERAGASAIAPTEYATHTEYSSDDEREAQIPPAKNLSAVESESTSDDPDRLGILQMGESATSPAVPRSGSGGGLGANASATNLSVFSGSAVA